MIFFKNPTIIIQVLTIKQCILLVETTEQKKNVKYKLCLYLQHPEMRPFLATYTERVACLLSVLTALNILLESPVVIIGWTQQTSFVTRQTAH